jgi:hypothetical protein
VLRQRLSRRLSHRLDIGKDEFSRMNTALGTLNLREEDDVNIGKDRDIDIAFCFCFCIRVYASATKPVYGDMD